jgi:hypothetical protein
VPYVRVTIPTTQGFAIEDLSPTIVIIEVDRPRLHKMEGWRPMGGWSCLLRGKQGSAHATNESRQGN